MDEDKLAKLRNMHVIDQDVARIGRITKEPMEIEELAKVILELQEPAVRNSFGTAFAAYHKAGWPYGPTSTGFNQWLHEQGLVDDE